MIQILIVGRHPQLMETMIKLVNQHASWKAIGCLVDVEAMDIFEKHDFDLVLLGSGLVQSAENALRYFFHAHKPEIPVVQHYGGGSGLLYAEVQTALEIARQEA